MSSQYFSAPLTDADLRRAAALRLCASLRIREQLDPLLADVKKQIPAPAYERIASTTDADLVPVLAPIYAKHFSPTELDALAAFFGTPLGHRYLELQPEMSVECQEAVNRFVIERVKGA